MSSSSVSIVTPGTPIRVGIVGLGNWARHGHLRVLSLLPAYELSAIHSRRADAARAAATEYGIAHVVDSLEGLVDHPESSVGVALNQFKEITITETGERIPTTNPDQLVVAGSISAAAVSIHVEAGKRNGAGVQIDITGDEGDLRILNTSAFGDVGDDYRIFGARGNAQPLTEMPVPSNYLHLPESPLPSAVLELAELYAAYAHDVATGGRTAPVFGDAVVLHRFLNDATRTLR